MDRWPCVVPVDLSGLCLYYCVGVFFFFVAHRFAVLHLNEGKGEDMLQIYT